MPKLLLIIIESRTLALAYHQIQ